MSDIYEPVEREESGKGQTADPITVMKTGKCIEVAWRPGITQDQAIEESGLSRGSSEVRVNGYDSKDSGRVLDPGDQILLVGTVSGG